ncbi:MAG: hypothetical protein NTW33_09535 [Methanoregula sp.]|nr:hypothetical protein [Methanoregula sp.]
MKRSAASTTQSSTLKEANEIAMKRGQVLTISGERSDHFNLIILLIVGLRLSR